MTSKGKDQAALGTLNTAQLRGILRALPPNEQTAEMGRRIIESAPEVQQLLKRVLLPKSKTERTTTVKTTIRVERDLWDAVQHRAIDEDVSSQELVERALAAYLKKGGRR